jgi:hypothetical protein
LNRHRYEVRVDWTGKDGEGTKSERGAETRGDNRLRRTRPRPDPAREARRCCLIAGAVNFPVDVAAEIVEG